MGHHCNQGTIQKREFQCQRFLDSHCNSLLNDVKDGQVSIIRFINLRIKNRNNLFIEIVKPINDKINENVLRKL